MIIRVASDLDTAVVASAVDQVERLPGLADDLGLQPVLASVWLAGGTGDGVPGMAGFPSGSRRVPGRSDRTDTVRRILDEAAHARAGR
jgi:hypothetical protein